ncbi:MAG: PTS sugar transporter subunit IIA [Deltaproteobacteria bacterium]|nr:PTS sugar transporter subunit IIA [Deltaproteobacteria bacterium]
MRLADVITEDCIIPELDAIDKDSLLREMVLHLAGRTNGLDTEKALQALLEREGQGTTGIGHGVAIPHGKIKGLDCIKVSFGRSRKGVDFKAMDNMPVHLFFLIIAPENSAAACLKLLASISRLLKNHEFRFSLMNADGPSEIMSIITEAERKSGILYGA